MKYFKFILNNIIKGKISHLLFILYLFITVFPLFWIFSMAFKTPSAITAIPPRIIFSPTFANFREAFVKIILEGADRGQVNVPEAIFNSTIIVGAAVVISVILALPAAYAFAKMSFKGKENFAFTILSIRFAPFLVVIVPLLEIYRGLGWNDTYLGMILSYQLITLPMTVWILRSFFKDIPDAIIESAEIDGASLFDKFRFIFIPILKPGIAASIIISFIFGWHQLTLPLILGGSNTRTVTLAMQGFIGHERVLWGQMAAGILVASIPAILVAAFFSKYIVRGITLGAVKE